MKHAACAQASPDIGPEGVFNILAGRIIEREGGSRGLHIRLSAVW